MSDIVKTAAIERAHRMAQTVMTARDDGRIGQIIGDPGSGKSAAGRWLAAEMEGARFTAWAGLTHEALLTGVGVALSEVGAVVDANGPSNTLMQRIAAGCTGRLIIIDEANHLTGPALERLRFLADNGAGLILIGTDLLMRTMNDARNIIYLAQLNQRIGGKRVVFSPLSDPREVSAYLITPRFGAVSEKTAKAFMKASGGNWRIALELGDTCERLMAVQKEDVLTHLIVGSAAALMAGQS